MPPGKLTLLRAADAGQSPLGHAKFDAGRGAFEALPAFVVGEEDEVLDWLRRYRDLWAWAKASPTPPPPNLAPPGA